MAKRVMQRPVWLKNEGVEQIYSVSGCVSKDFADYIPYWQHNGYWLFDSPQMIKKLAQEQGVELEGLQFFYYEAYPHQCYEDDPRWESFEPEASFKTAVLVPDQKILAGFDVVSFSCGNAPECSYLSCNHMAETTPVNKYCLLERFEEAKSLLESKAFEHCEPGPCRIFAVYTLPAFSRL